MYHRYIDQTTNHKHSVAREDINHVHNKSERFGARVIFHSNYITCIPLIHTQHS